MGGGFSIGNNYNGQLPQTGNTYQFSDNYSKIIGTHSLKFGADVRYQMFDQLLYFDVNGDLGFVSSPFAHRPATTSVTPMRIPTIFSD